MKFKRKWIRLCRNDVGWTITDWHTRSLLLFKSTCIYVVPKIHFPFVELSGFKLDWFVASNCKHFTSLYGQVQLIRYFSRAKSVYFSHFTGLYFSGVVSVVQQLSAVTSLPWQPLSAHSRRQGARKSPTDILSSAQFLVEIKYKICQQGGLIKTTTLSQKANYIGPNYSHVKMKFVPVLTGKEFIINWKRGLCMYWNIYVWLNCPTNDKRIIWSQHLGV